jgi:hypothetical protein
VDPDDRQVVGFDCLEIALGLGIDQLAEGVRPAGDGTVDRMVRGELDEPAGRWSALVELAGRMEEAWPVSCGRGAAGPAAEEGPDPGERVVAGGRRGDERLDREIGVRATSNEMPRELPDEGVIAVGAESERRVTVQGEAAARRLDSSS